MTWDIYTKDSAGLHIEQLEDRIRELEAEVRELEAALERADRHAETVEFGYCDVPHKLGDTAPDGKALLQIPHEQNEVCENWKPVQVRHLELWGRIQKAREILREGFAREYQDALYEAVEKALTALEGK